MWSLILTHRPFHDSLRSTSILMSTESLCMTMSSTPLTNSLTMNNYRPFGHFNLLLVTSMSTCGHLLA